MSIAKKIKSFLYWHFNYDRVVEKKIKKNIALWHRGGSFNRMIANLRWSRIQKKYSCNIPPLITVGKNLRIEHALGVYIGQTSILGDNVRIYQFAGLLAKVTGDQKHIDAHERRHPKIGNNVILAAHCSVIGTVTVGDNSIIGAGAIVTRDIPPNSVVTGINVVRPRREDERAPRYKASYQGEHIEG